MKSQKDCIHCSPFSFLRTLVQNRLSLYFAEAEFFLIEENLIENWYTVK